MQPVFCTFKNIKVKFAKVQKCKTGNSRKVKYYATILPCVLYAICQQIYVQLIVPNFAVASKLKRQTPGTLGSVLSKNDGHYEW